MSLYSRASAILSATVFLISVSISNKCLAGADEDAAIKAFGEAAIEAIATEFLKDQLNQYVVENIVGQTALDAYLASEFGEKAGTGVVNQLFAAYGFLKAAESFDKADTQSQKYYSTVSMIGAGVSFVLPPVGALIQLANVASQIGSAALTKSRVEELMELQREIVDIYKGVVEKKKNLIVADFQLLNFYYGSYFLYLKKSIDVERLIESSCSLIPADDTEAILKCFDYAAKKHGYLKLAVSFLDLALSFSSEHVDIDSYLKLGESKLTRVKLQENIASLKAQISKIDESLEGLYRQFAEQLYEVVRLQVKSQGEAQRIKNECLNLANRMFYNVNKLELKLRQKNITEEEISMLISYRIEQLTQLKNSSRQCLLIEDLEEPYRNSLIRKIEMAKMLEEKPLSSLRPGLN